MRYGVCFGTNQDIKRVRVAAEIFGFRVEEDGKETFKVFDGEREIYTALRKDSQYWVVRYHKEYFA